MNSKNGNSPLLELPKPDPVVAQTFNDVETHKANITGNPVQDGMSDVPLDIRSFHFMKTSIKR